MKKIKKLFLYLLISKNKNIWRLIVNIFKWPKQLIGRGFYKINDKSSVTLEGVRSTKKIYKLIKNKNINCPIVEFVNSVLSGANIFSEYNRNGTLKWNT